MAAQFIYYRNNYMGRPEKKYSIFVLKMRDFVLKITSFVLNMMNFGRVVLARERAYHGTTYMVRATSP